MKSNVHIETKGDGLLVDIKGNPFEIGYILLNCLCDIGNHSEQMRAAVLSACETAISELK